MKNNFKLGIIFFIFASLILIGLGCSTTKAIKNRYQANRKGKYNLTGEMKEITHAMGEDVVGFFSLLGKGIGYLGKGLEKTGQLLQGKK